MKLLTTVFALVMLSLGLAGFAWGDVAPVTLVEWSLDNLTWTVSSPSTYSTDIGTISGYFYYDPANETISNWSITVAPPSPYDSVTFGYSTTGASAGVGYYTPPSGPAYTELAFSAEADSYEYYVYLEFNGDPSQLDPGSITLLTGSENGDAFIKYSNGNEISGYPSGGQLDPVVPLPPSAYLLSTGLISLVWLRRKNPLGR